MEEQSNTVTLREIAQTAQVPESSLRLWRDEFEGYVPAVGAGRRRRYDAEGAERLRQIARWKQEGHHSERIAAELEKRGPLKTASRRRTTDDRIDDVLGAIAGIGNELSALRAEVEFLRREVLRLSDAQRANTTPAFEDIFTR
jgi:DNA-binding transcriptional MerR regulator